MAPRTILTSKGFGLTIDRLCRQLIENHGDFLDTVLIGLQPRGVYVAQRLKAGLEDVLGKKNIQIGAIDVTFSRDDFRRRDVPIIPSSTQMDFIVEDKKVVLIDDVLYTGRTVRAGLDEVLAYGRPKLVELLVLIDRRFCRQLPIEATYVGKTIDSIDEEKVKVQWSEIDGTDKVLLHKE